MCDQYILIISKRAGTCMKSLRISKKKALTVANFCTYTLYVEFNNCSYLNIQSSQQILKFKMFSFQVRNRNKYVCLC